MSEYPPAVRTVAWREIFPWFLLFRCWGISLTGPILLVATAGVLVGPSGFWLGGHLFLPTETRAAMDARQAMVGREGDVVWEAAAAGELAERFAPRTRRIYTFPQSFADILAPATSAGGMVVQRFLGGWQHLITPPGSWNEIAFVVLGGLWALTVWAMVAGVITRVAVLRLGCDRQATIPEAVRFVVNRYRSYFAAPLLPLAPLVLGVSTLMAIGWMGNSGLGIVLVGIAWPLVLVGGVVLTVLLLGVALGWPFMWVALGTETDADAFEAVSRGYTYALQRPLRLISYVTVAALIGLAGWMIVYHVSEILLAMVSCGLPSSVLEVSDPVMEENFLFRWGTFFIQLGNEFVRSVARAYGFSFFFCAATAIYLLLRRDIDEAPLDQVFDEHADVEPLQLPPLPADLLGAHTGAKKNDGESVVDSQQQEHPTGGEDPQATSEGEPS